MIKNKQFKTGLLIGIGVSGFTIGVAFIILGLYALFGGEKVEITDVSEYEKILSEYTSENTYNYPAYVAVDANAHTYEYALLSGENQITYVLLSVLSKVHLDGEYMPLEYGKEDNLISGIWDYSIYLISEEKEGDMIVSRDYDFSREEQTEVLKYHYFKNRKDAMYGLPEKKIYEDLEGCRLVKLELDTEQKIATVTYEKNGETGTWTCNYEE